MGALCAHVEEPVQKQNIKSSQKNINNQTQQIMDSYSKQQNQLNFVLAYWDIRGLAQVSRFLLEYLGFKYTNKVYKDPQSWFGQDKLKLETCFPNLPYLQFEQTIIVETQAIEEFIIKKSNESGRLLGQDQQTKAQIWMLIGVLKETFSGIVGQTFKDTYEDEKQQNFEQKFKAKLNMLHSFLGNKKFLLGNISYPDFLLYELILYVKRMYPQEYENLYKQNFDNFSTNFEQLEKIQIYIKSSNYPKKFLPSHSKFSYDIDFKLEVDVNKNVNEKKQENNFIEEPQNNILTLGYWKIRGKVQALIFLAEYLQLKYQMKYYTNQDEWFNKDKNKIQTDFPNLPYMQDDSYVLTESQAIAQYLIYKSGKQDELLSVSDLNKQATLNMILGVLVELQNDIINMCLQKNKFDELRIKNYQQNYHFKLKYLRNYLGDKVYLLGSVSWADFLLYEVLQYIKKIYHQQYVQFFKEAFEKFENEFLQIPQIKKYVEKSRQNYEFTTFLPSEVSEFTGNEFFDSFEYSEPQNHLALQSPQKSTQNDEAFQQNQHFEAHNHQQQWQNHQQLDVQNEQQQEKSPQKQILISNEQQMSNEPIPYHAIQSEKNEEHETIIIEKSPQKINKEEIFVQNLQQSPQKQDQAQQNQVHASPENVIQEQVQVQNLQQSPQKQDQAEQVHASPQNVMHQQPQVQNLQQSPQKQSNQGLLQKKESAQEQEEIKEQVQEVQVKLQQLQQTQVEVQDQQHAQNQEQLEEHAQKEQEQFQQQFEEQYKQQEQAQQHEINEPVHVQEDVLPQVHEEQQKQPQEQEQQQEIKEPVHVQEEVLPQVQEEEQQQQQQEQEQEQQQEINEPVHAQEQVLPQVHEEQQILENQKDLSQQQMHEHNQQQEEEKQNQDLMKEELDNNQ